MDGASASVQVCWWWVMVMGVLRRPEEPEKQERPNLVAMVRSGREIRAPSQPQRAGMLMGSLPHGGADA